MTLDLSKLVTAAQKKAIEDNRIKTADLLIKNATDVATANAYAKLTALKSMTPAQVQAWTVTNITTLAQAQDAIATLAIAVSILARRL